MILVNLFWQFINFPRLERLLTIVGETSRPLEIFVQASRFLFTYFYYWAVPLILFIIVFEVFGKAWRRTRHNFLIPLAWILVVLHLVGITIAGTVALAIGPDLMHVEKP